LIKHPGTKGSAHIASLVSDTRHGHHSGGSIEEYEAWKVEKELWKRRQRAAAERLSSTISGLIKGVFLAEE